MTEADIIQAHYEASVSAVQDAFDLWYDEPYNREEHEEELLRADGERAALATRLRKVGRIPVMDSVTRKQHIIDVGEYVS